MCCDAWCVCSVVVSSQARTDWSAAGAGETNLKLSSDYIRIVSSLLYVAGKGGVNYDSSII